MSGTTGSDTRSNGQDHLLNRRTIVKGAVWSMPVIAVAAAAPTAAASGQTYDLTASIVLLNPGGATDVTHTGQRAFEPGGVMKYKATYCNDSAETVPAGTQISIRYFSDASWAGNTIFPDGGPQPLLTDFGYSSDMSLSLSTPTVITFDPVAAVRGGGTIAWQQTVQHLTVDVPLTPGQCFDVSFSVTVADLAIRQNATDRPEFLEGIMVTDISNADISEDDLSNNKATAVVPATVQDAPANLSAELTLVNPKASYAPGDVLVYRGTYCNTSSALQVPAGTEVSFAYYSGGTWNGNTALTNAYQPVISRFGFTGTGWTLKNTTNVDQDPSAVPAQNGGGTVAWRRTTRTLVLDEPLGPGQCREISFSLTVGSAVFRANPSSNTYTIVGSDSVRTTVSNSTIIDTAPGDDAANANSGRVIWTAP